MHGKMFWEFGRESPSTSKGREEAAPTVLHLMDGHGSHDSGPRAAGDPAVTAPPVDDLYAAFLRGPGAPAAAPAGAKSAHQASASSAQQDGSAAAKAGAKPFSSLIFKPRQTSVVASKAPFGQAERPKAASNPPQPPLTTTVAASVPSSSSSSLPGVAAVNMSSHVGSESENVDIAEFNSHASFEVEDAYDPQKPNDYLAYCKEREERKRLAKLAEDNQRKLEELERQRLEMERQRKEAAEKGDFQKLLEGQQLPAGRGRGRGLINLPSWITQQMNSEAHVAAPVGPSAATQFQDAEVGGKRSISAVTRPSCVLLLLNMATVEEVKMGQADLMDEIRDGCEKYGPVTTCDIFVLREEQHPQCPVHKRVRVFVQFQQQDAAIRALKDLNGRFFGGRQVSASFYDEESFRRKDWLC